MDQNPNLRRKYQKIILKWFWKLLKDITKVKQASGEESSKKLKKDISVKSFDRIQSRKYALQGRIKKYREVLQPAKRDNQRGETRWLDETSPIMETRYLEFAS